METLHHTLQDFFRSVGLPLQQDMELTVHRLAGLHGDKPMSSPLFRTNYYSFLLIQKGKGRYTIDNHEFELRPGSFYFTNPGHLKSFTIEALLEGYMLTFSEQFVKQHYTGDFYTLYPFLMHETSPVMQLDEAILTELSVTFEQMLREYNGQAMFKGPILTKYLAILLYKTKELLQTHKASFNAQNRSAVLVGDFKKLLNENFRELATGRANKIRSVKEFAERLNVHPNYLTNVVKDETGKPASEWIQERTLAEAQSLLNNTKLTVSEITFRLGFSDTAHFGKFFKKRANVSPSGYRQSARL